MRTVYKYGVATPKPNQRFEVKLPRGAHLLDVDRQGVSWQVWAQVESTAALETVGFMWVATGGEIDHHYGRYVKTVHTPAGEVYHLYKRVTV